MKNSIQKRKYYTPLFLVFFGIVFLVVVATLLKINEYPESANLLFLFLFVSLGLGILTGLFVRADWLFGLLGVVTLVTVFVIELVILERPVGKMYRDILFNSWLLWGATAGTIQFLKHYSEKKVLR